MTTAHPDGPAGMEQLVHDLFDAWGSGDPAVIEPFFHPDAVVWDSVNGEFRGWPAIRDLYLVSLERWDDLTTVATRFWHGADGSVAFTWTMTGRVADDRFGAERRGELCTFDGMTYVVVEDGLVVEEIEYFDRAAAAKSIGLVPSISFS